MISFLLIAVIYLIFVSLGLPDSLLGSGWPTMQVFFDVPSSYAGYVSMTISFMTILSALISPYLIRRVHTKWIVVCSIFLTVLGLMGFSAATHYWMLLLVAIPYGLGAGSIDASVNHYVANHYSSSVMNFLHCFYGLGAVISPMIMGLALKHATWSEGYRWTSYIQMGILAVCLIALPLWKINEEKNEEEEKTADSAGIRESLKVPGVLFTLIAFFSYCAGENTCFLWTSSYFAGTKEGLSEELVASFGALIFGGLMVGRLIAGFISNRLGDRKLIRLGTGIDLLGILLILLSGESFILAAVGFFIAGVGMGPVYPAVQHMAPTNFGKKYSAAIIGMQMAAAYVGSTFMPMVFGHLQQWLGIGLMPFYMLLFAVLTILFLELSYKKAEQAAKD